MRRLKLVLLVVLALGAAACILKSTHHTLYLEPDGSVVWTVLEEDVHSNQGAAAKRHAEECDWLAAATAGDHGVARGLALLGGEPVTRVLRSERPFVVWTEARFDSLEELGHRLVDGLKLPARFEVVSGPDEWGITLELDLAAVEEMDPDDNPLIDLLDGVENARFVVVEGRFITADGFELADDGRSAQPLPPPAERLAARQGSVRWALRWSTAGSGGNDDQGAGVTSSAADPAVTAGHDALAVSGRGAPAS